jgi:hypothetical protein
MRLYLVLAGNSEGSEPNSEILEKSILALVSGAEQRANEAIFYTDEARVH